MPLFVCMPPWADVTLYDVAARNILRGGVHYRDVFDTNLPGMPWLMAAFRVAFGRSYEALRAADLLVVGAIVWALCGWVRRAGGTGYAVAWFVAAAALFYPFQTEYTHIQRDVWMLLPAVVAARLRLKKLEEPTPQPPPCREGTSEPLRSVEVCDLSRSEAPSLQGGGWGVGSSPLEGFIWGVAVWLKPHVVVPAFAVWLTSAILLTKREPVRRVFADLGGLVLGGLLAGVPGVLWLVYSGAWEHFLRVFLEWNPHYLADAGPLRDRFTTVFDCLRPWSVVQFAALPLALLAVWRACARRPDEEATARVLLAALYLGWMAQAVLMQKAFDYVHTPLTFLGMAILAGHRWCFGFVYLLWFLVTGLLVNVAETYPPAEPYVRAIDPASVYVKFEKHPLLDGDIIKLWPRCWREGSSPELRDRLGQYTDIHCGTKWQELEAVAAYLRPLGLGDGELNCWHDSTHPLYLLLDLKPATRYMHYGTVFAIRPKRAEIVAAVRDSPQKYVVSDLLRTTYDRGAVYRPESWRPGDPLPVWLPAAERERFPWNQPVVFRSGRYVVHKIDPNVPLGVIRVPDWGKLDQQTLTDPDD